MCGARESRSYFVGERHRLGCDEPDCRASRRRHDHLHHSCADSGACLLCAYEGTRPSSRHPATKRTTARRLRVCAAISDDPRRNKMKPMFSVKSIPLLAAALLVPLLILAKTSTNQNTSSGTVT